MNPYLESVGSPSFHTGCNFATGGSTILPANAASTNPFSFNLQLSQFFRFKNRALTLISKGISVHIVGQASMFLWDKLRMVLVFFQTRGFRIISLRKMISTRPFTCLISARTISTAYSICRHRMNKLLLSVQSLCQNSTME